MKTKKVLVVGGGGRCHAIVDALLRSPQVAQVFCAPGNAGTGEQATNVPIRETDIPALLAFARERAVDLTVIGPEAALAAGVADAFREAGLAVFGHTKAATRIESSKAFAKELMQKYAIPTAGYRVFSDYGAARDYVASRPLPAVLKYDGLAAGKGVVVAQTMAEAEAALREMLLEEKFGGGRVIVEDYLSGPEFSFMCFVSGEKVAPMPLSQDHKRAYDGDTGPNTGGMGAYTGLPFLTEEEKQFAFRDILCRTAKAMCSEGLPLSGVLYGGLMKTPQGIRVIEFNARFGDPETEVVLPLLESDFYAILEAVATGGDFSRINWKNCVTLGVVLASKGYPGNYAKGFEILAAETSGAKLYHMGTTRRDGKLLTAGGRVMMVVGEGATLPEAREKAYGALRNIRCEQLFWRNDIGHIALNYEENGNHH